MSERHLRDELDCLREENRQLKALLIPEKFEFYGLGLGPNQRKVLALLMARSPEPVSTEKMLQTVWFNNDEVNFKIVDVIVFQLRARLKPLGIQIVSLWKVGRYIDNENRKKLLELVESKRATGGRFETRGVAA